MIRKAVVAGQFYPEDREELLKTVSAYVKEAKAQRGAIAAISPHAGYPFSGKGAALSLCSLKNPEFIVLLGFSHSGLGARCGVSLCDWETPLGIVNNKKDISEALAEKSSFSHDEDAHMHEHSIEVQLPFIQHLFPKAGIVPVSVSHDCDMEKASEELSEVLEGKDSCIVASSDFTHHGAAFGYVPFQDRIRENIEKLDMGAIKHIIEMDSEGFLSYVEKTGATICGSAPIALLLDTLKGSADAELLKYYTSGDVTGDDSHSVSYASIAFYPSQKK